MSHLRCLNRAGLAGLVGLTAVWWTTPASAQTAPAVRTAATRAAIAAVPATCRAEIIRFCPAFAAAEPQGRSAAICLKPFKSSLSLSCRKAVRAVFP